MKRGNTFNDLDHDFMGVKNRVGSKVPRIDPHPSTSQRDNFDICERQRPEMTTPNRTSISESEMNRLSDPTGNAKKQTVIHDCELIVMEKSLTRYAEMIEKELKELKISTDIIYPNVGVPANRMVKNMADAGCLYAVVIDESCRQKCAMKIYLTQSLLPHEERFLSIVDGMSLISNDYRRSQTDTNIESKVGPNISPGVSKHPVSIQKILESLTNSRDLSVPQLDEIIHYLSVKRDEILRIQVEDLNDLASNPSIVNSSKRRELESKIMGFLNKHEVFNNRQDPDHRTRPDRQSGPQAPAGIRHPNEVMSLLNNPNVQRAVDNLLQANVLQGIGIRAPVAQHQSGHYNPRGQYRRH